jgi:cytochrome bd-type quinol oxidase subunit 1
MTTAENAKYQPPAKLAAMEAHWKTHKNVPFYLLTIPNEVDDVTACSPSVSLA